MPELPEVETVKETLKRVVLNKKIIDATLLYEKLIEGVSGEYFLENIKNQTINDIKRRGKWLIFELDDFYLLSHLRMEGKFFVKTNEEVLKHEHIVFNFSDGTNLRYHDTRKFGRMYLLNKEDAYLKKPLVDLGLEPWDEKLTIDYLKGKFKNKKLPIKTILLDQSIIVGIGNIYDNEILFLSGINPYKKVSELSDLDYNNIINNTKFILERAIKLGGTTIKSFSSGNGIHGLFQNELFVHTKKVCHNCHGEIVKEMINGRGTYYCPNCQK